MKKTVENRYPHSATLFKFCKKALEIRYEGNVKVIDQDVGSILGYDPADCSHWKKGKKNIHALSTLRTIADHLNLDEGLLIDIAAGKVDLEEAIFEFRGYGAFNLNNRHVEDLKKDFFRNPEKWQKDKQTLNIEQLVGVDRENATAVAERIIEKGKFSESPVYMPEVFQQFTNVNFEKVDNLETGFESQITGEGLNSQLTMRIGSSEIRPYIRFQMAKQLFKFLCMTDEELRSQFSSYPVEIIDIQANIFAAHLLIPANLLREELKTVDSSINLVSQLSESFWVSTPLMNQRLKDYLEFLN